MVKGELSKSPGCSLLTQDNAGTGQKRNLGEWVTQQPSPARKTWRPREPRDTRPWSETRVFPVTQFEQLESHFPVCFCSKYCSLSLRVHPPVAQGWRFGRVTEQKTFVNLDDNQSNATDQTVRWGEGGGGERGEGEVHAERPETAPKVLKWEDRTHVSPLMPQGAGWKAKGTAQVRGTGQRASPPSKGRRASQPRPQVAGKYFIQSHSGHIPESGVMGDRARPAGATGSASLTSSGR